MNDRKKILIVDDEPIGRQLLEAIFFSEDYELHFADNGQDAIDKTNNLIPDLILLDVMMPELDGFEVCRHIRDNKDTKRIPIILITALDDRDSRIKGLDAGANDYISKPFDRSEILAKVKNFVQLEEANQFEKEHEPVKEEPGLSANLPYYINQIHTNLSSPDEFINNNLTEHFKINYNKGSITNTIFWLAKTGNKIILLFSEAKSTETSDLLINILSTSLIYKIIQAKEPQKSGKIIEELSEQLIEEKKYFKNGQAGLPSLNLSIVIIDNAKKELQFSGLNQLILLVSNESFKKIELDEVSNFPNGKTQYTTYSFDLLKSACFYSLSHNLAEYFKTNALFSKEETTINDYFQELQKRDMKEQKDMLKKMLEKAQQDDNKLNDFAIIGVRI